jgi:hypothetical protein
MECVCRICGWKRDLPEDVRDWASVPDRNIDIYPVTEGGKPHGVIQGFLCAKCLRNASSMRLHVKAVQSKVRVTTHALDRFLERQEGERISSEAAKLAIIRIHDSARPIRFKERFMTQRLLNNGGKPVHYLYAAGWIVVTTQESPATILTIERNWHRKLGYDFWYIEE